MVVSGLSEGSLRPSDDIELIAYRAFANKKPHTPPIRSQVNTRNDGRPDVNLEVDDGQSLPTTEPFLVINRIFGDVTNGLINLSKEHYSLTRSNAGSLSRSKGGSPAGRSIGSLSPTRSNDSPSTGPSHVAQPGTSNVFVSGT
jgi:hypothetical protein